MIKKLLKVGRYVSHIQGVSRGPSISRIWKIKRTGIIKIYVRGLITKILALILDFRLHRKQKSTPLFQMEKEICFVYKNIVIGLFFEKHK